jgi:hypothetical protein
MDNILDLIFSEMYKDNIDYNDGSEKLLRYYNSLDDSEKNIADNTVTHICGFSLKELKTRIYHEK